MVVFIDGQPRTAEYRRFKIKTVEGANDFASMAEILGRRFKRGRPATPMGAGRAHRGNRSDEALETTSVEGIAARYG